MRIVARLQHEMEKQKTYWRCTHFHLTGTKKVGSTTNMLDIVTATQLAGKVISIG